MFLMDTRSPSIDHITNLKNHPTRCVCATVFGCTSLTLVLISAYVLLILSPTKPIPLGNYVAFVGCIITILSIIYIFIQDLSRNISLLVEDMRADYLDCSFFCLTLK